MSVVSDDASMRLELDAGNTRIKWRLLKNDSVVATGTDLERDVFSVSPIPLWLNHVQDVWVSSVHQDKSQDQWLSKCFPMARFARTLIEECGLKNSYKKPDRMGVDRWLAMLAAWGAQPDVSHIVIDAGTAITLDVIDASGQHLGGYICPGFNMMKSTLLSGTSNVLAKDEWHQGRKLGDETQMCVDHGIQDMVLSWVEQHCQYRPEALVWVSGGDGVMLSDLLTCNHTYNADLVLDGLAISFKNTIQK